jgi:acyl carrier protein
MATSPDEVTREQIETAVKAVIADMLGIQDDDIALEDHIVEDLELDSMDAVDLVVDLKLKTGVKLVESDIKTVEMVRDIVDAAVAKASSDNQ